MRKPFALITALAVVGSCAAVAAKEKRKTVLPQYVLDAQTAMVLIDPDAAIPVKDPSGNKIAQDDVEKALMKWGRLRPVMTMELADLVIVIRKGNKEAIDPTVSGPAPNDRPVIVQGTDSTVRVGVQHGRNPDAAQTGGPTGPGLGSGGEIGPSEDFFSVYQGKVDTPLTRAPVWQYKSKNGLKSPDVPAVGEFKKAVDEAVKQQQEELKKKQQQQQQSGKP